MLCGHAVVAQDAKVVYEVKKWLAQQGSKIKVLAKIESATSVKALDDILDAVDGAMVARGDLGAELPVEDVPYWQSKIVQGCRWVQLSASFGVSGFPC